MKMYIKTKDLLFKSVTWKIITWIVSLKLIIVCLIISNIYYSHRILVIEREVKLRFYENKTFSESRFKEYLLELNIQYPDLVFSQAKLETGNFQSNLFKQNSNLFGMRMATSRPTTSNATENGYAFYNNWKESVQDYAMYQAKFLSGLTRVQYIDYLGKNYSNDTNYIKKLSK